MAGTGASATPTAVTNRASKASLEVVRSTIITAHAASSFLANAGDRQSARLLRAAEGLARQALVLLSAPAVGAQPACEKETVDGEQQKKKRRRKKKKGAKKSEERMDVDTPTTILDAAKPGTSVWVGDLSEVGIPAGQFLVASPGSAPRVLGMATTSSSSSSPPIPTSQATGDMAKAQLQVRIEQLSLRLATAAALPEKERGAAIALLAPEMKALDWLR